MLLPGVINEAVLNQPCGKPHRGKHEIIKNYELQIKNEFLLINENRVGFP